ncbi:hypothetical protein SDC9_163377 [bioreactor metagenome]|uniref:Uncharacterized protein n=1 Tax=bioreactor metagenome TaxID=1076179 RepID=A0A645FRJ6_9ZZZZ
MVERDGVLRLPEPQHDQDDGDREQRRHDVGDLHGDEVRGEELAQTEHDAAEEDDHSGALLILNSSGHNHGEGNQGQGQGEGQAGLRRGPAEGFDERLLENAPGVCRADAEVRDDARNQNKPPILMLH